MSGRENDSMTPPRRLLEDAAEHPPQGAADAWAVDLLRVAEPYRPAAARKQRIQLRLGHARRRRASFTLRLAVAAVVLVGGGAFARAALGRWPEWMVRVQQQLARIVSPATPPTGKARIAAPGATTTSIWVDPPPPPVEPEPVAEPEPALDPAPAPVVPSPVAAPRVARPAFRGGVRHAKRSVPAAMEDSAPVVEAMRALRRERDPVRARALLSRYLERYPTGTLAEEALALSIEAAVAHGDVDAAGLAARYLRLYPAGPFRPLARQTLAAAAQQP
jgi:hypothetical protein